MRRRLHYPALLLACFAFGYFAVPTHAATPKPPTHGIGTAVLAKLAPPINCTMRNRLDVFIDEDNIMWECTCEVLSSGFTCHWQVIGGVEAVNIRRHPKRHHITHGRSIWTYIKPTVVG